MEVALLSTVHHAEQCYDDALLHERAIMFVTHLNTLMLMIWSTFDSELVYSLECHSLEYTIVYISLIHSQLCIMSTLNVWIYLIT